MNLEHIKILEQKSASNDEYTEELKRLKEKETEYYKQLEALQFSADILDRAFSDCSLSYVSELSGLTGSYLSDITEGARNNALVDESLAISIETEKGYKNIHSLSCGAREQTYLSMRLALSDMLFSKNTAPLFFDDVLAFYDDKRCQSALETLLDISQRKQIFFSTCRGNECDFLIGKGVKVIEI